MSKYKIGYAICGSFCTINDSIIELKKLVRNNFDVYPIFSPIVYATDTRFTNAKKLADAAEEITGNKIITSIVEAEPIGPKKLFDILAVCPCTGNTLAKLVYGITDTCVTMSVKAHIRNNKPVVIAMATNDALGASAKNIGHLLNTKNFYFVPMRQDEPHNKERSVIADFSLLNATIDAALKGEQIKPILL